MSSICLQPHTGFKRQMRACKFQFCLISDHLDLVLELWLKKCILMSHWHLAWVDRSVQSLQAELWHIKFTWCLVSALLCVAPHWYVIV